MMQELFYTNARKVSLFLLFSKPSLGGSLDEQLLLVRELGGILSI